MSNKSKSKNKYKGGNSGFSAGFESNQIKKQYAEVEFTNKPTLIISKQLQSQILYAHSVVGNVEWSGFVFFKETKGSIKDLENFEMTALYLHILDVGTSGYTEFTLDGRIVEAFQEFPDAKQCKTGMAHTHHTMDTFFSGTDMRELHDNAEYYPYYLSLIVNHYGKYCAKLAVVAKEEGSPRKLKTNKFLNLDWVLGSKKEQAVLITMDCNIVLEQDEHFVKRLAELNKPKTTYKHWNSETQKSTNIIDLRSNSDWDKDWDKSYRHSGTQQSLFGEPKLPTVTSIDLTRDNIKNYIIGVLNGCIIDESNSGLFMALKQFDTLYGRKKEEKEFIYDRIEQGCRDFADKYYKKTLNDLEFSVLMSKCCEILDLTEYKTSVTASELGDIFSLYCYDNTDSLIN